MFHRAGLTYQHVARAAHITRHQDRLAYRAITIRQFRVTRRELSALAGIGADEGTLMGKEKRVIQNLLRLKYIRAGDVMTPRSVGLGIP